MPILRNKTLLCLLAALGGLSAACGDDTVGAGGGTGGGVGGGAGGGDGGHHSSLCFGDGERPIVDISADVTADTTWTNDNVYCLTDLTFVSAKLVIEPGTLIQGTTEAALIVTREGELDAVGTAEAPIVFTSSAEPGDRASKDWKGLALLGNALLNGKTCVHEVAGDEVEATDPTLCTPGSAEYYFRANLEGIDPTNEKGLFGGLDDAHSCGHLAYVRVEFAGAPFSTDNELNGITLGACGSDTLLEYVQVHRGFDDGIEHFGGSAELRNIVISSPGDDALDWDLGYRGKVQFLVIHHPAGTSGDPRAFEADSLSATDPGIVVSAPTIYNATLVGGDNTQAMLLREGTAGTLQNFVIEGFGVAGVEIKDAITLAGWDDGALLLSSAYFWDNANLGPNADSLSRLEAVASNKSDVDPQLGDVDAPVPNFVPATGAALTGVAPIDDGFFDASASYAGAFEPGGDDWTAGWTAYPAN